MTETPHPLHDEIIRVLRSIHDPEIPVNIHDLGLIYGLEIGDDAVARVKMTLTAPNCPMAEQIVQDVRTKVAAVDGIESAEVELVWEPAWDPSMMTEAARLDLEFTGHTGPAHLRKDPFSKLTIGRKRSDR